MSADHPQTPREWISRIRRYDVQGVANPLASGLEVALLTPAQVAESTRGLEAWAKHLERAAELQTGDLRVVLNLRAGVAREAAQTLARWHQ